MRKPPLQDVIVKNQDRIRRPQPRVQEFEQSTGREYVPQERRISYDNDHEQYSEERRRVPPPYGRERRSGVRTNKKWLYTALGIASVVILTSLGLSLMFAGATVTVHPKQDTVVVDATFKASSQNPGEGGLAIQRIVLERTAKRVVDAKGEEEVEERASGKITIYNEYSDTPQRLIKNTRFESTANRIYRIQESIEVPGKKSDGSAGTIEVTVYAEEPGEAYNIENTESFTIPGFSGLPQEELIYAKSNGPLSGGFKGVKRTVEEEDRSQALKALEQQLRDELLSAAFTSTEKPEGYHLFKDAVFFEFNTLPDELEEEGKVSLMLSGKLHGVLFPTEPFAKLTATLTLTEYSDSPIRIDNMEELSVTVKPQGEGVAPVDKGEDGGSPSENEVLSQNNLPWQSEVYDVAVKGKARFIWEYNDDELAKDLAGKNKDVIETPVETGVLSKYPGIDRIEANVVPFWKTTFPDEVGDILVVTKLDD